MFDLLVIDDSSAWREIVGAALDRVCNCYFADTKSAIANIRALWYKAVCLSLEFHTWYDGHRLLTLLSEYYPDVPIIILIGSKFEDVSFGIENRYRNVKGVLIKSGSSFLDDLRDMVRELVSVSEQPQHSMAAPPDHLYENSRGNGKDLLFHSAMHQEQEMVEAYAVARIKGLQHSEVAVLDQEFLLLAGILSRIPGGFKGIPFQLRASQDTFEFEIRVYAEDMDVQPAWNRRVVFDRRQDPDLVEFKLRPNKPGSKRIQVEFYYQQHWLAQIRFEVKVVEAS